MDTIVDFWSIHLNVLEMKTQVFLQELQLIYAFKQILTKQLLLWKV